MAQKVYKCLTWGSISQCLAYIAAENRDAAESRQDKFTALKGEVERILPTIMSTRKASWFYLPSVIASGVYPVGRTSTSPILSIGYVMRLTYLSPTRCFCMQGIWATSE